MASSLQQIAASITERSRTLINNDLKKICKEEGTSQTGNKAALQSRVVGRKCSALSLALPLHRTIMVAASYLIAPYADFTLTSHHQCRLQKRRRGIAAVAVSRATSRRRTTSRSQQ
jgi:hypothetical protein